MADDDLFTDDVLERPASWGVMLRRGFMKHCPRCGGGHLYRGWFRMHDRCPRCGMRFEREEGFFVGAYLINFAIVEVALFVVLMGLIVVLSQNADAGLKLPIILCATLRGARSARHLSVVADDLVGHLAGDAPAGARRDRVGPGPPGRAPVLAGAGPVGSASP